MDVSNKDLFKSQIFKYIIFKDCIRFGLMELGENLQRKKGICIYVDIYSLRLLSEVVALVIIFLQTD